MTDKARENRARRAAERQGLTLAKSRTRDPLALAYGWYIMRGRRRLAHFRELDRAEYWLAHPEERDQEAAAPAVVTEPGTPLRPAIVAAIVTSSRGVLVERRHDGSPLWTFPAGEAEPGESPADTAVRETKEETGLQVKVSHVIGEQERHRITGRHMIYLAGRPYQGTAVHNGDEAELGEVTWVSLETALERMPSMFGPVRQHLETVLAHPEERDQDNKGSKP